MPVLPTLVSCALLAPGLLACAHGSAEGWQEPVASPQAPEPPPALALETVMLGLKEPTYVLSAPGDPDLLIVLEKAGRAQVIREGQLRKTPFLDMRGRVASRSEQGLLGMDFHPRFPEVPDVFVHYSREDGDTRVSRFTVDTEDWIAVESSERILLEVEQPYANHDGGQLEFGRDGYLYLGLGDGGAANDPLNAGQDLGALLGKILRIDIDGEAPYAIPKDNPFVGREDARPEIWAWGLRNPWRFSFDPANGDIYIGDVGQNKYEEISWAPGSSKGGENYGWRLMEGDHEFKDEPGVPRDTLVPPIHEYAHGGRRGHCSVVGGYVYRGEAIPDLQGWYFYGDTCSGAVGVLMVRDGKQVGRHNLTDSLAPDRMLSNLVSFGEDAAGELYAVTLSGGLYRIVAAPTKGAD
jgi:glucose/arabinose dehydrogenase